MKSKVRAVAMLLLTCSLIVGCGDKASDNTQTDNVIITAGDSSTNTSSDTKDSSNITSDIQESDIEQDANSEDNTDNTDSTDEANEADSKETKNKTEEYNGLDIPSEATLDDNIRGGWINDDGDLFEFLGSGKFSAYIASENLQWKGTYETDNMSYVKLKYKVYDNSKVAEDTPEETSDKPDKSDKPEKADNKKDAANKDTANNETKDNSKEVNTPDKNTDETKEDEETSEEIISDGSGKVVKRVYNSKGELISEEDYTKEFYSKPENDGSDRDKLVSDKETELTYELMFSNTSDSSGNEYKILTLIKGKNKFELIKQYNI